MTPRLANVLPSACFVLLLTIPTPLVGQLNAQFGKVFSEILDTRLRRSAGIHGTHYLPSAAEASRDLTPALNSLIVNNVSSFPLASSTVGITFDFSTGTPVSNIESLGPTFSDNAATLGASKLNLSLNYSFLPLSQFRGLATEDMRFTFTHQNISDTTILGDNPTEKDLIDVVMGMKVRAHIVALVGTYGITKELDVSVGVPLISVNLSGEANATIESYTYATIGEALHNFGSDSLNPVLETKVPYDQSATGIGDIAVKLKYNFTKSPDGDLAALADIRIPTGKAEDFLGSGNATVRVAGIYSRRIGRFTPHVNLGYEHRSASLQSSRIDIRAGFDQMVQPGLTFAFDFLGAIDLDKAKAIKLFPGFRTITHTVTGGRYLQKIDLSNVPERDNDNMYSLSAGIRFAPSEKAVLIANILTPLNNGGLRASVVPTVGFIFNF